MAKARLLQAVCTVALLAAVPAFAQQTTTQPATTGANNTPNTPVNPPAQSTMTPANNTGSGADSAASSGSHSTHHAAMKNRSMHSRTDSSQDAAVDQLNSQSYQAAQQGQTFSSSGLGSTGTTSK